MCGGGGGGGQRALEEEEKALLRTQAEVAQQGIRGRGMAMSNYEGLVSRGRELGSTENIDRARQQYLTEGLAAMDRSDSRTLGKLASRGANVGDLGTMSNALLANKVDGAAAVVQGSNDAALKQRQIGLSLETAGTSGLAGFDPSNALNSMANTISSAQRTSAEAAGREAAGWGQVAQAGSYALQNYDKIAAGAGKAWDAVSGVFSAADGGLVPAQDFAAGGIVRPVELAMGGNVYDQAMMQSQQMSGSMPNRAATPPPQPTVSPLTAVNTASKLVDKASKFLAPKVGGAPGGGQLAALDQIAPVGGEAAVDAAAQSGLNAAQAGEALAASTDVAGAAGIDAAAGAAAGDAAAAAAGTAAAEGAATAGLSTALGAVGTALPVVGLGLAAGSLLGLFRDGGQVPSKIGKSSKTVQGRAANPAGGKVKGPGGPKDDKVPAWLSPGEFVMPVEAVQKYGIDRLESMRQKALNPTPRRNAR